MKKLSRILTLSLISLTIIGCNTIPTVEPAIIPFTEIVPIPTRPTLVIIPQELSEALKALGLNLVNTTTHIERLEDYITLQDTYYKRIFIIKQ